jgi:hypothetical protein
MGLTDPWSTAAAAEQVSHRGRWLPLLVANLEHPVLAASRQAPATGAVVRRAVTRVLKHPEAAWVDSRVRSNLDRPGCCHPRDRFLSSATSRRAIASATERSSRARSGPSRRTTAGSSPMHSRAVRRVGDECDRRRRRPACRERQGNPRWRPDARRVVEPGLCVARRRRFPSGRKCREWSNGGQTAIVGNVGRPRSGGHRDLTGQDSIGPK